jgi:pimeloyl-ACP methyl ester carboxylesterase
LISPERKKTCLFPRFATSISITEFFGQTGPWLALITGGRRGFNEFIPFAEKIAAKGFQVLLHDRRNTGASDVLIAGQDGEEEIWADDLAVLLEQLGASPAFIGGTSSGARLSMLYKPTSPAKRAWTPADARDRW